jgi:hypothetical protein
VAEFVAAREELKRLGVALVIAPGAFCVNYLGGLEETAIYSDGLQEAVEAGFALAEGAGEPLPPMGPTGRRNSRRGLMYRHNLQLAGRRGSGRGAL